MSVAQKRAYEQLFGRYAIPYSPHPLDFALLFGCAAPTILEIGFGMGETTAAIAMAHPDQNYLGIEVHRPGVGHLLMLAATNGSTNLRASQHDAVEVLREQIPPASLDELLLLFPDPWHKKRHHHHGATVIVR